MNAEKILAHCKKVKPTGNGSWIACCPAHDDKNPSMTVREIEDRLLVHCFAGCSAAEIVGACGLQLEDLFPEKTDKDFAPAQKRRFPAADVLLMVEQEINIVSIVAGDVAAGRFTPERDLERMRVACRRLQEARRLALG